MTRKPKYLPQISAPYKYVVDELEKCGVVYKDLTLHSKELLPSQGVTFLDTIIPNKKTLNSPIWVAGIDDSENIIIDGHNRWVDLFSREDPIRCIKIHQSPIDASRTLNKIQDIYDYKKMLSLEEVVTHTQNINDRNDKDSDDWLGVVFEESKEAKKNKKSEKEKLIGYRDKPINETSLVGNFFTLNKLPRCDKYEIEFDNLLDTNELGIEYKDNQKPMDVLAMLWFPNINFNEISEKHQIPLENIKSKAIVEYAKKMGYDGIKYGDMLVQGF